MLILKKDIKVLSYYAWDEIGEVFIWKNRCFRRIYSESRCYVEELIRSNAMRELIDRGLFVNTWINEELELEGNEGALLLEHEKILYNVYSMEYSLAMKRAIGLSIIAINQILMKYGYELSDPHYGNIAFRGCKPVYLDIGSIVKLNNSVYNYLGIDCFERVVYYPLLAQSKNKKNNYIIEKMCQSEKDTIKPEIIFALLYGGVLGKVYFFLYKAKSLYRKAYPYIYMNKLPQNIKKIKKYLINFIRIWTTVTKGKNNEKYCKKVSKKYKKYEKKLMNIRIKENNVWSNYHDTYFERGQLSERQQYIIDVIKTLNVKTCMEIAGNTGLMSANLIKKADLESVICTDYDKGAIDKGFSYYKEDREVNDKLTYAVIDILDYREMGKKLRAERFKSDVVLMMAVTHHLLLTQKIKLGSLINIVSQYTNKYLVVEFMPLGLWGGNEKNSQEIPDWYSLDWFKKGLKDKFKIISEKKIDTNRICILCELK